MRCSNCGVEIPVEGRICPVCKVDKTQDKVHYYHAHWGGVIGAVLGLVIGFFFVHQFEDLTIPLISGAIGFVIGSLVGKYMASRRLAV